MLLAAAGASARHFFPKCEMTNQAEPVQRRKRCAGRKNAGGAAAGGEFQKSESVALMAAIDGGDRHARRGVGLAESLAIVFCWFFAGFCC